MEVLKLNIQGYNDNSNEILITGAAGAIEQMKYEIASEFGVTLGPETSARANGSVGGEITKRLVRMGQEKLMGQYRIH
ncbi:alpha/beta-type small acid-soluble spore protein [Bacillus pfraonensis]|nr:alpha/beta-type small acid-soluble spore protein [Bacillus pseudomycoides]